VLRSDGGDHVGAPDGYLGDTEADIRNKYVALGYELLFPDDILELGREERKRIAGGVTGILDEVYNRALELSAERTRQLIHDVDRGHVLLSVLLDKDGLVVATTAFTRVEPVFPDSRVSSYEAGRTAKRVGAPPRLAAEFLRAGFIWAAENLRETDYLVAEARVARADNGRPYNGDVLGRLLDQKFTPTHAAYSHYVAQNMAEPFVWTYAPTSLESWQASVRQQKIHLPVTIAARMLGAMLAETLDAQVIYAEPPLGDPPPAPSVLREMTGPSPKAESLYVLSRHPMPSRKTVDQIPSIEPSSAIRASAGLSDKIIVEEDIVNQADSAHALHALHREGFELAGWTPSSYRYGRIALVLTRPGTVPAKSVCIAPPDLSALGHLPSAHHFLDHVLSRRPVLRPCTTRGGPVYFGARGQGSG
jgi:hypothetical protein